MAYKICIFGGSFDPFHDGHKEIVETLLDSKLFDKIIITPSFANPLKAPYHFDNISRIQIIRDMMHIRLKTKELELNTWEIESKNIYTINCVRHFKNTYKDAHISLAIGADNLAQINAWKESETLKNMVDFVLFTRALCPIASEDLAIRITYTFMMDNPASSSEIRKNL